MLVVWWTHTAGAYVPVPDTFPALQPPTRPAVQTQRDLLPKGAHGALPETEGEVFSVTFPPGVASAWNADDARKVLVDVLPATGFTGDPSELVLVRDGLALGYADPVALEISAREQSPDFLKALEARVGPLTKTTLADIDAFQDDAIARLSEPRTLWRFDQTLDGLPVEGMSVLLVVGKESVQTVHGALVNEAPVVNKRTLDPAKAEGVAIPAVGSGQALSSSEVVVLDGPDLRYAWHVVVKADEGTYDVWVDTEQATVLQIAPQFHPVVPAQGRVFDPSPLVGTSVRTFDVDDFFLTEYHLGNFGVATLSNYGADGYLDDVVVEKLDPSYGDFDVAPHNDTTNVTDSTQSNYNGAFSHVNLFAWVDNTNLAFFVRGSEPIPDYTLIVNDPDPCGYGPDNACGTSGYLAMGVGSATLGTSNGYRNSALDATVIVHETGHGLNATQLAVGGGTSNQSWDEGVADYWAISLTGATAGGEWFAPAGEPLHQDGYVPREADPEDVFPEHLVFANEVHANGQIMAWALWNAQQETARRHVLGNYTTDVHLMHSLRSAGIGQSNTTNRKVIYTSFRNLLLGALEGAGSSRDAQDLLVGFARAGITVSPQEAIIAANDDYLALDQTDGPLFTVWTGRDFVFTTSGAVDDSPASHPYNTRYEIELANDEAFTVNVTSSGVLDDVAIIDGVPRATWQPSASQWYVLRNGGNHVYYKVTTTDNGGGNVRSSLFYGDAEGSVATPYVILNGDGEGPSCSCDETGCASAGPGPVAAASLVAAGWLVWRRRRSPTAR